VNDAEPEPFLRRNRAPDLPHFGKHFDYHGPSGVLTFRIDIQEYSEDGLVHLGGIVIRGEERFETGHIEDRAGKLITVTVTESQYMRLSNGALT
jgi:hypothetical protein